MFLFICLPPWTVNITTQKYESDYQDISGDVVNTNSTRPCSRLHVADLGEPPGDVVTSMETGRCHNYLVEVDLRRYACGKHRSCSLEDSARPYPKTIKKKKKCVRY